MSRLKETQIKDISSSFDKNVLLLTQIVPPSVEFQQHFKKGMFDKPNMVGFLHVSHYLSSVYDAKLFKRMVRWPILCKRDEATFRIEMMNFLCLLSRDNPDINFPSILLSHLILAGGTKFQIIMWKLSQLALRSYLKREHEGELLNAPRTGPVQDLTIVYFNNTIVQKCSVITETREKMEKILKATNNFLIDETEILNAYKSEIFDRKENMKKLVLDLPAHQLIKERLMNVEDFNIIDLWKRSTLTKIQYVHGKNKELNELEELCNCLCKLILRINSNPRTLEASKFFESCCDNYLSNTQSKHLTRNLHVNGSVVFSTLLSLLYSMFAQILHHENVADLSDLSPCLPFIQNACKKMSSLQILLSALNTRIAGMYENEQCTSRKIKSAYVDFDARSVSIVNSNILLQSPKICFNLSQYTNDNLFYERLCSSPMEGKHKDLFKRYKRKYRPLYELPSVLPDFSNSWNNMSGWLSPRAHLVKRERILFKGKPLSPLYSRLLSYTKLDLRCSRENISRSPSANYEGLNLTPKKRPSERLIRNSYGSRMRNFSIPS